MSKAEEQKDNAWGTRAPYTLVDTDPEGAWLTMCQAREDSDKNGALHVEFGHHGGTDGDEMRQYLLTGPGPGELIQGYVGRDPTGRFVVLRANGSNQLRDMRQGTVIPLDSLGLDQERDNTSATHPRTTVFGEDGKSLLLLLDTQDGAGSVLVYNLLTKATNKVPVGKGRVWRAWLSPDASWVTAHLVTRDTNGNGQLDLPSINTTLFDLPCSQPASYSTYGLKKGHDQVSTRFVHVASGRATDATGFLFFFGDQLVRRLPSNRGVVMESPEGKLSQLVPASCRGPIIAANQTRRAVLVACAMNERPGYSRYVLFDERGRKDSSVVVPTSGLSGMDEDKTCSCTLTRLPVDIDAPTSLFSFETAKVSTVPSGYRLCTYQSNHVLLARRDAQGTFLWDTESDSLKKVSDRNCGSTWFTIGNQSLVQIEDEVFDFSTLSVVGKYPGLCSERCDLHAHEMARDGRILLQAGLDDSPAGARASLVRRLRIAFDHSSDAALGPLLWVAPEKAGRG